MLIITLHGQNDYFNMQRFFKISCIKKHVFFKKNIFVQSNVLYPRLHCSREAVQHKVRNLHNNTGLTLGLQGNLSGAITVLQI